MAIFIGEKKNTRAVRTALKINFAVRSIINPCITECYPNTDFRVSHGVGINCGNILATRAGIRGANDLVWVGPASNYAAKMSALRTGDYPTWISKGIFDNIDDSAKSSDGKIMWEPMIWNEYNKTVYRSNYWWKL